MSPVLVIVVIIRDKETGDKGRMREMGSGSGIYIYINVNNENKILCVILLALSASIMKFINPGWVGLAVIALLHGDTGNPAIIFSEQGIVISPPVRERESRNHL